MAKRKGKKDKQLSTKHKYWATTNIIFSDI
jgi:hypothetical protein